MTESAAPSAAWNLEEELQRNPNLHREDVENLRRFCESLPCARNVTGQLETANFLDCIFYSCVLYFDAEWSKTQRA